LSKSKNEEVDDTSVFDQLGQIEISDIAFYIFEKFNLIKKFIHIKPYRSKQEFTLDNVIACTLAAAFGCSLNKMFEISDLNLHELRQTYTNAIRLETLRNVNDALVNEIAELDIFPLWDIIPNKRLSDADGQKFETRLETIQSRHSSKFFGLAKGIVPYTLVTNYVPINNRIISPNEHESHFTFDIIYNNTSEIQPDMITGDMHSINQLNFFILDVINVEFVPTYRDIYDKSKKIYCIGDPKQHSGLIKPIGQININLIKEQSKTIEKMLLSLILQETKQSIIVKKLSSHKRYGRLKKALWEYNKILSSIHILNLIDNKELRRNIKIARNRTESFHQLQSKIRKVHGGKFSGRTILENEIWNQSARLVANMSIAYNSLILNDLLKKYPDLKSSTSKISPIAWRHINFTGKYTFKEKKSLPDLKEIIEKLKKWL
jgi:TnpA family transposase